MQIADAKARRKTSPIRSQTDPIVIRWLTRRYRLRRPIALVIADETGLGAR